MNERLQKIISSAGVMSRRQAEEYIAMGHIAVNGKTAVLGQRADPEHDVITIKGKPLDKKGTRVYVMLHKPRGYITSLSDDRGRKTVADLVSDVGTRLYPVGRLDYDSEGLLLMTNDGDVAHKLMHPKFAVRKTYHVLVTPIEKMKEAIQRLNQEMVIDGYRITSAQAALLETHRTHALLSVNIGEGRNRQVRKMCSEAGLSVQRLIRVSEGNLHLDHLPQGQWRYLTENEQKYLQEMN